jgi:hypothetical protein
MELSLYDLQCAVSPRAAARYAAIPAEKRDAARRGMQMCAELGYGRDPGNLLFLKFDERKLSLGPHHVSLAQLHDLNAAQQVSRMCLDAFEQDEFFRALLDHDKVLIRAFLPRWYMLP